MQREKIDTELSSLAFDFFFWYSRFEFALKEHKYLKSYTVGAKAEAGWDEFVRRWQSEYRGSVESEALIAALPERQVVGPGGNLTWMAVDISSCKTEMAKLVRLLQTVRNNLFHGGKSGGAGWDDPKRTTLLLSNGIAVLNQFSEMAGMENDYLQFY
jgi:hypothetical protein